MNHVAVGREGDLIGRRQPGSVRKPFERRVAKVGKNSPIQKPMAQLSSAAVPQ
ncbi:MAG: hypothetical protein KatS3mg115_2341 [Candidatus Poribacteria bacterium]|nr:MAG: hypothetical protein KatS3mg115_2341 [Candidatus Poribacteria bacterium]